MGEHEKLSPAQERALLQHRPPMGSSSGRPLRAFGIRYSVIAAMERKGLVTLSLGYSGYETTLTDKGCRVAARLRMRDA